MITMAVMMMIVKKGMLVNNFGEATRGETEAETDEERQRQRNRKIESERKRETERDRERERDERLDCALTKQHRE